MSPSAARGGCAPARPSRRHRVGGDASEIDTAGTQFDEEADVEGLQADGFDGEEVAGEQVVLVVLHQGPPADGTETHRGREDVMSLEHIAHGAGGDDVAQLLQLTGDLAVAPA